MSGHTPGPWRADRRLGCKQIRGRKAGTHKQAQWLTEVACTPGLNNEAEDLANAILIESATLMLETLMAIRDFVAAEVDNRGAAGSEMSDYQNEAQDALDRIDASIAKATGG